MGADTFWSNREQAQRLIDEGGGLRKKIEPIVAAEKQLADFQVLVELGEAEEAPAQVGVLSEINLELDQFERRLAQTELRLLLNGPHDRKNCIFSPNRVTGQTCCCGCTSAGARGVDGRWR